MEIFLAMKIHKILNELNGCVDFKLSFPFSPILHSGITGIAPKTVGLD